MDKRNRYSPRQKLEILLTGYPVRRDSGSLSSLWYIYGPVLSVEGPSDQECTGDI